MIENTLTKWSAKQLKMYKACPFSVYLHYIKRVPVPPPDPKFDEKRQRGIRLHEELANTINNGEVIPQEAEPFSEIITAYIELGAVAEGDEFFDNQWKKLPASTTWRDPYWLVVKKDVRVVVPNEFVIVGDWKTGKKHGNELDHFEQMTLYAVSEYVQDPGFPEYVVELQYLDQKETWSHTFKPHELEKHWARFDKDVAIMFNDTLFRPKPNIYNCRYCPFNKKNNAGKDLPCPVAAV